MPGSFHGACALQKAMQLLGCSPISLRALLLTVSRARQDDGEMVYDAYDAFGNAVRWWGSGKSDRKRVTTLPHEWHGLNRGVYDFKHLIPPISRQRYCPGAVGGSPQASHVLSAVTAGEGRLVSPGGTKAMVMQLDGTLRIDSGCTGGLDCQDKGWWVAKDTQYSGALALHLHMDGRLVLWGNNQPPQEALPPGDGGIGCAVWQQQAGLPTLASYLGCYSLNGTRGEVFEHYGGNESSLESCAAVCAQQPGCGHFTLHMTSNDTLASDTVHCWTTLQTQVPMGLGRQTGQV